MVSEGRAGRILHIVGGSRFGGGALVILQLCLAAQQEGYQTDVLTTDPTFKEVLESNSIGVVDLPVIWRSIRPVRDVVGLLRLCRWLKRNPYTIVHTHTSKGGFVGRLAATMADSPCIVHTVHGFAFHEDSSKLTIWLVALAERLAAHWCDRIVTVSEFHRRWALALGIAPAAKIVAIPNGIGEQILITAERRQRLRLDLGVDRDTVLLFTAGRLAPQKGLEYLLQSLPLLSESETRHRYHLCIAGTGLLEKGLRELSRDLGISDMVSFLGFRDDVRVLDQASDIVVLPSLWEGLSISVLEAMAAAKPIVTTDIGSNLEVIENGVSGIIVPRKDPAALAAAIKDLADRPAYAEQLGESAHAVFEEKYTERKMVDAYMGLYASLVAEHK